MDSSSIREPPEPEPPFRYPPPALYFKGAFARPPPTLGRGFLKALLILAALAAAISLTLAVMGGLLSFQRPFP